METHGERQHIFRVEIDKLANRLDSTSLGWGRNRRHKRDRDSSLMRIRPYLYPKGKREDPM